MSKVVFGLANACSPYNFTFETTPGSSNTIVELTLPAQAASQDYALSSSNPIEQVNLSVGNSGCTGQLVLKENGHMMNVDFVGSMVQISVAQCDFNGAVAGWVAGP